MSHATQQPILPGYNDLDVRTNWFVDALTRQPVLFSPIRRPLVRCPVRRSPISFGKHMAREPKQLRRDKEFHYEVQRDWTQNAQGNVEIEKTISLNLTATRLRRRRLGRLDIFLDEEGDYVAVVEIKATDWTRIPQRNAQRNLSAHRRQVWRYITKFLDRDHREVCAGIIYPSAPQRSGPQKANRRVSQWLWPPGGLAPELTRCLGT